MSRLGFCPRRLVAEALRKSTVFARKYPPEHRDFMEKQILELPKAGSIYSKKRSRWSSPPLVEPPPHK